MYQTVSEYDFREAFRKWQNGQYKDNFTYDGLGALYNWFIQLEEDTGEQSQLDVVAICCEFTEYVSLEDLNADMVIGHESIEALKDHTTVIEFQKTGSYFDPSIHSKTDAFIIQNF